MDGRQASRTMTVCDDSASGCVRMLEKSCQLSRCLSQGFHQHHKNALSEPVIGAMMMAFFKLLCPLGQNVEKKPMKTTELLEHFVELFYIFKFFMIALVLMTDASHGMYFLVWLVGVEHLYYVHVFISKSWFHNGIQKPVKKGKKRRKPLYLVSHHKSVELTLYRLKDFLISHLWKM